MILHRAGPSLITSTFTDCMNTYHEDYEISALFPFNFVTAFFIIDESSENNTMSILAFIRDQKEW